MAELLEDKEIIQAIKLKYSYHLEQAQKYKAMLQAYNNNIATNNIIEEDNHIKGIARFDDAIKAVVQHALKLNADNTFEDNVVEILKHYDKPMITKDLVDEYNKLTGKAIIHTDFSSKMASRSKTGQRFKNKKFEDFPFDKRYWWGLTEWFDGGFDGEDFKPKYQQRISP